MKKLKHLGKQLSKIEQKNIKGGLDDEGGQCIGCSQEGTTYYSCWYTTSGCDVCSRVYPHGPQCLGTVGCMGCTMN